MSRQPPPPLRARAAAAAGLVLLVAGAGLVALGSPTPPAPTPPPRPSASLPATAAGDLYVDPGGDDAATGGREAPLRTVQAAVDRAAAGTTIWLAPGTYAPFRIAGGGATRGITVAGSAAGTATIKGGDAAAAISIEGAAGVTLLDLAIDGPAGSGRAGVRVERSNDLRVEGLTVQGVKAGFGLEIRYSSDVAIVGNDVSHNAVAVRVFGEGDPASVHDVSIEGNWLHDSDSMVVNDDAPNNDFGGNGIIWHKVGGPTVARDNQVWNNRASSHDYGTDGGAFEIWGSSQVQIVGNTAWDNVNVLESGTDGPACTGLTFRRNTAFSTGRGVGLILRCAEGGLVANNTLVGLDNYAFELSDRSGGNRFASSIDGLRILGNIVADGQPYAIANALAGTVTADRNVLWNPGGLMASLPRGGRAFTLEALGTQTGFDGASRAADPRFVDAAARDYRILPASPAVDLGAVVDDEPFTGEAPDAGRYELGEPPPSPVPSPG